MPTNRKHNESVFTQWFQEWYLPFYFELDKRRPHLSSMIHSGQMTRQQVLDELEKPLTLHHEGLKFLVDNFGAEVAASIKIHKHSDYPNHERLRQWAHKIYKHF